MKYLLGTVSLLTCIIFPLAAQAQTQNSACTDNPHFAAFDFWLGDWDVYAAGNLVGSNSIVKLEQGCALLENWSGAAGSTGVSLNYFNPVTEQWRQLWVSAGEYAIDISGGMVNDSMVMIGELYNYGSDETFMFRGTWTPNSDSSVRQFFEQVNPQSNTWEPWFDGRYVPRD